MFISGWTSGDEKMTKFVDVSNQMDWNLPDDEFLPVTKCVCGTKFPVWSFSVSIYDDNPKTCPICGRKFFFSNSIRIYEVIDD